MAKVLQIDVRVPNSGNNDPEVLRAEFAYEVLISEESAVGGAGYVFMDAKNGLGVYKSATTLNQEVEVAAKSWIESNHSIEATGYDKTWLTSGFSGLL